MVPWVPRTELRSSAKALNVLDPGALSPANFVFFIQPRTPAPRNVTAHIQDESLTESRYSAADMRRNLCLI